MDDNETKEHLVPKDAPSFFGYLKILLFYNHTIVYMII